VPFECHDVSAALWIPYPDSLIIAGTGQQLMATQPDRAQCAHPIVMAFQDRELLIGMQVPDPNCAVGATAGQHFLTVYNDCAHRPHAA
jgi:hypothetical protein